MDLFNLMAKLSLDGKDFDKGVKDADRQGKNLANKLERSFKTIQKVAKAVFAGYLAKTVTGTLRNLVMSTAQFGDVIDKQSQVLGISRKAYQQWEYILGQNGASIDDMTISMRTMNQLLTSAGEDSKEAKDALAKLGVSMDFISSMPVEDQFSYLVGQFQKLPQGADKSTLAVKLFGRNGMTLLPLLNQTAESIGELRQQAEDLGLIMSDDDVDASVKFGDALDTLKRTWNAFKRAIGAKPLDALTKGIDRVTSYLGKLRKAYDQNGLKGVWSTLISDIKGLPWPTWKDVKDAAIGAWNTVVKGVTEDLPALVFGRKADGKVDWPDWNDVKDGAKHAWNIIKKFAVNIANEAGVLVFGRKEDGSVDWPDWDSVKKYAEDKWNDIKQGALTLAGLVFGKKADGTVDWPDWNDVKEGAKHAWTVIKKFAVNIANEAGALVFGRKEDGEVDWPDWNTVKKFAQEKWDDIKRGALTLAGLVFGKKEDGSVDWPTWNEVKAGAIHAWTVIKKFAVNIANEAGALVFGRKADGSVDWPTWNEVKQGAKQAWKVIKKFATNIANEAGGLIFGRKEDGSVAWPDWDTIKQTASDAWTNFAGFVAGLPKLVFGEGTALGDGLTTALNLVKEVGSWAIENGEKAALAIAGIVGAFGISKLVGLIAAHPAIAALTALIVGATANSTGIEGLGSVATAIEAIGAAFLTATVVNNFIKFADTLKGLFTGTTVGGGWGAILGAIAAIGVLIYENWDTIEAGIELAGAAIDTYIIQPLQSAFDSVTGWFNDNLVAPLKEAFDWLKKNLIYPIGDWLYETAGIGTPSYFARERTQEAWGNDLNNLRKLYGTGQDSFLLWSLLQDMQQSPKELAEKFNVTEDEAKQILQNLRDQISEITGETYRLSFEPEIVGGVTSSGEALGDIPSYRYDPEPRAKGAWYVPYDNYLARLHRGERVLTASQARHGEGGVDAQAIAAAVKQAVGELVGSFTMQYNGKEFAKVVANTSTKRVHRGIDFANAQTSFSHGAAVKR